MLLRLTKKLGPELADLLTCSLNRRKTSNQDSAKHDLIAAILRSMGGGQDPQTRYLRTAMVLTISGER